MRILVVSYDADDPSKRVLLRDGISAMGSTWELSQSCYAVETNETAEQASESLKSRVPDGCSVSVVEIVRIAGYGDNQPATSIVKARLTLAAMKKP